MEALTSTIDLISRSEKSHSFNKVSDSLNRSKKGIEFGYKSPERRNFDKFLIRCVIRNFSSILDEHKDILGEKYGNSNVEKIAQSLSTLKQAERENNSKMDYAKVILHLMKVNLSCEVMVLIIKYVLNRRVLHKNIKKGKNKKVYLRTMKDYCKHLESILHHSFEISQSQ